MKKNNKKMITTLAACALIGAMAVGGTMAYLTDTATEITNTFTVGEVKIGLEEPNWNPDKETPWVPNEEQAKDPTVANIGKNDAIMFVEFDVPMARVVTANDDGKVANGGAATDTELFGFKTADGTYNSVYYDNDENYGWVEVAAPVITQDEDGFPVKKTYFYGYQAVIPADDTTTAGVNEGAVPAVFDKVRMANVIEGQIDGETLNMPVRAYAIQADYVNGIETETDLTVDELKGIYAVYVEQNK